MNKLLLSLFLIATSVVAFAKKEKYPSAVYSVTANTPVQISLVDPVYSSITNQSVIAYDKKVYNTIELYLDYTDVAAMRTSSKAEVELSITYTNAAETVTKTKMVTLNYNHQAGASEDKAIYRIEGGNIVDITITPQANTGGEVFPSNLKAKASIEVERYYSLNTSNVISTTSLSHSYNNTTGTLDLNWVAIQGAEWYDVEWAYVNDYTEATGTYLDETEIVLEPHFFKNNSTRISQKNLIYSIPLVYEHGYIIYRIRAVGKSASDSYRNYVVGKWSDTDNKALSTYSHKFSFSGHEQDLNWQFISNFAEDGKSKVAVSYFDGSLRNRQSVSRLNTEDETIAGETIYDHQGRGAVQILPVPTGKKKIEFNNELNVAKIPATSTQSEQLVPYHWEYFDKDKIDASGNKLCDNTAGPLATTSGASKYYSPANSTTDQHHQFLPDAEQYPFTQIEYTPDNTGRISRQGGVGKTHQLGSGHETQYYYSKPDQEELDRLFGSEVGEAKHYKKNTVEDANGQLSISYLDPQGRVVATALAGSKPTNVEKLPSFTTVQYSVDLLDKIDGKSTTEPIIDYSKVGQNNKKTIEKEGGSLEYSATRMVTSEGDHQLEYKVDQISPYKVACTSTDADGNIVQTIEFCRGCVLNLEISLNDKCGTDQLNLAPQKIEPLASQEESCDQVLELELTGETMLASLAVGTYSLEKKLVLDRVKLDEYVQEYVNTTCHMNYQDFLTQQYSVIDTLSCDQTCGECKDQLDLDFPVEPQYGDVKYEEYQDRKKDCEAICGPDGTKCKSALQAMLLDVSPHGQYALLRETKIGAKTKTSEDPRDQKVNLPGDDTDVDDFNPSKYPLSLFNEGGNQLRQYRKIDGKTISFRSPTFRTPYMAYLDDNGLPAKVRLKITRDKSGVILDTEPKVVNREFARSIKYDDKGGYVAPEDLTLESFVSEFQPSWAYSLLFYHPEYMLYLDCQRRIGVHEFFDKLNRMQTLDEAIAYKIIKEIPASTMNYKIDLDEDPLFRDFIKQEAKTNGFSVFRDMTADKVREEADNRLVNYIENPANTNEFYSLWQVAFKQDNCPGDPADASCPIPNCPGDNDGINNNDTWETARALYIGFRSDYEETLQEKESIAGGYYNGCIGNENFNMANVPGLDKVTGLYEGNSIQGWFYNTFYPSQQRWFFNEYSPCSYRTKDYYTSKTPRFPLSSQSISDQFIGEEWCASLDFAKNKNACPDKIEYIGKLNKLKAQRLKYKDCGQCPIITELERYLADIAKNKTLGLNTDPIQLGCPMTTQSQYFSDPLISAMGFVGKDIKSKVISENNSSGAYYNLTTQFYNNTKTCDITYKMSKKTSYGTANFNPDAIKDICCVSHLSTPILFTASELSSLTTDQKASNVFTFSARYGDRLDKIEGEAFTTCLSLDKCSFPELCVPTPLSFEIVSLMTMLAQDFTNINALTTGVDFDNDPYSDMITTKMSDVGITKADWKWQASLEGTTKLNAAIEKKDGTQSYPIVLEVIDPFPVGTNFDNIEKFSAFRADITSTTPSSNWLVNAKIKLADGTYEMITMKITVDDNLPVMNCQASIEVD